MDISDLSSISRTCKSFKDLSDSDLLWKNVFGQVAGTCTDNTRWRYQLDAKNTVSKCCYKSKGNFKQCFYNDQLPAVVCEEKRKGHEADWLKKIKYLHDLPQLQITFFLTALFLILVRFAFTPISYQDITQINSSIRFLLVFRIFATIDSLFSLLDFTWYRLAHQTTFSPLTLPPRPRLLLSNNNERSVLFKKRQ